jgi:hypothetical protein
MKDELTMANINLYAVLRNLEDLCSLDSKSKSLIADRDLDIQFTVKNGPAALLSFHNGKCSFKKGSGKSDIKLYFPSPSHLNRMFEGKANPIPLKGFTKIGFLKNEFSELTDRLTYFLRPTDELLQDPDYFKLNTILTAHTVFFALAEIGNSDRIGRMNAARMPDGIICISVLKDGFSLYLNAQKGRLTATRDCVSASPRAIMSFADMETTNSMLNGRTDAYTCIADGTVMLKGFVPMLDTLNKLLALVPAYLK